MILTLAVILGLIAGLICYRGRAFNQIAALSLRSAWLALLAVALQWPLLRAPMGVASRVRVEQVFLGLSYLLLLVFVWRNRDLVAIKIIGLGVICNLAVIAANQGFMPITPETLVVINPGSTLAHWPTGLHYGNSKDIILPRQETALWLFSDFLAIPPPFPWPVAFSLGDLFIALGVIALMQGPPTSLRAAGRCQPS